MYIEPVSRISCYVITNHRYISSSFNYYYTCRCLLAALTTISQSIHRYKPLEAKPISPHILACTYLYKINPKRKKDAKICYYKKDRDFGDAIVWIMALFLKNKE